MSANETLRRRIAAYGAASSRDELLDELTREIRRVKARIAEAEGRHSRPKIGSKGHYRPRIGSELASLESTLVELHARYEAAASAMVPETGEQ
jgi:hypothetical protein